MGRKKGGAAMPLSWKMGPRVIQCGRDCKGVIVLVYFACCFRYITTVNLLSFTYWLLNGVTSEEDFGWSSIFNGIWSCNDVVTECEVYCCFSDGEQKCGVQPCTNLNGADVRTFDVVTFTSAWCTVTSAVFRFGLTTGISSLWYYPIHYCRCYVITLAQVLMR